MRNKNIFIITAILLIGLAFFFGSKTDRILNNVAEKYNLTRDENTYREELDKIL